MKLTFTDGNNEAEAPVGMKESTGVVIETNHSVSAECCFRNKDEPGDGTVLVQFSSGC